MPLAATIEHTASKMIGSKGVQGFLDTAFAKDVQSIAAAGGISTGKGALGFGAASAIGGGVLGAGIGAYRDDSSAIGGALGGAALGLAAGGMGLMGRGIYKGFEKEAVASGEHTAAHTAAEAIPAAVAETAASPVAGRSLKERVLSAASAGVGKAREAKFAVGESIRGIKAFNLQRNKELLNTVPSVASIREQAEAASMYMTPEAYSGYKAAHAASNAAATQARRAPYPTRFNGTNFTG